MTSKQQIVILTGAGVSAESGIKTFRDNDGLWENYAIEDVATFEAWQKNKTLVLDFYNQRRRQLLTAEPNIAHTLLVKLEKKYAVQIITQNVDNLHEKAGSSNIIHLHGELLKVRSTLDEHLIYDWTTDLHIGDKCAKGAQLRPHIVWFGEQVPMMDAAIKLVQKADILIIIGTSLAVYPAASLIQYTDFTVPKYVIDPNRPPINGIENITFIEECATKGVQKLVEE